MLRKFIIFLPVRRNLTLSSSSLLLQNLRVAKKKYPVEKQFLLLVIGFDLTMTQEETERK
jgi:hypothetical protein